MAIDQAIQTLDQEVVNRMHTAYEELKQYNESHSLLSYMILNARGQMTLTSNIILIRSFLKKYDAPNPANVCLNYALDLERAVKEIDELAYKEPVRIPKKISA